MQDLISRQAAIDALADMYCKSDEDGYVWIIRSDAWARIDALPSAQPERIRGRWIEKPHVHGVAYCSLCDYELHTNDTNFCPKCGADMRGEQDGH